MIPLYTAIQIGLASILFACSCAAADLQTFASKTYGYSLQYPAGWHFSPYSGGFDIENFPSSKAVRGMHLPSGGAEIYIVVPSQVARSPFVKLSTEEQWIQSESSTLEVLGTRTLQIGDAGKKLSVVEVKSRCCGVPPFQEWIYWYYSVDARWFRASLGRWEEDANAEDLHDVFSRVVLSMRVVHQAK